MSVASPLSPARLAAARAALAQPPPRDLDGLEALRAAVRGAHVPATALRRHLAEHPADAAPLWETVVPALVRHARALLVAAPALPPHAQGRAAEARVPRADTPGWVAALLLGALQEPHAGFPGLDTDALWGAEAPQEVAKLRAMLALFEGEPDGRGALTVRRQVAPARTAAQWADDDAPLTALTVATAGGIEDAAGHLQVDFANRFLGGGVLSGGCVQEEIRFAVSPELLVGLLVSPQLLDGEAVVLHGAAQVARTRGYASGLRYDGAHRDPVARLADGTPDVTVVAIDAIDFRKHPAGLEATEPALLRELQKAHAGCWPDERRLPIATGNWGCGVFGGDPALKAMLQWMAASTAGRAVRYYPYGDARVAGLDALADDLRGRGVTVGGLWRRLRAALPRPDGLFAALRAGG